MLTRQVEIATEQFAASDRPCVYPITPHTWLEDERLGNDGRFLSFRNGGTGIARNVVGEVWWHDEDGHALLVGQTVGRAITSAFDSLIRSE